MGVSPETCFGFRYTVRLRAFCLNARESIANVGICDSCGIVPLSGQPAERQKHCKVSRKELEAQWRKSLCLHFS